jgi:murein L,D-transpeptidase YcbB/YkuD
MSKLHSSILFVISIVVILFLGSCSNWKSKIGEESLLDSVAIRHIISERFIHRPYYSAWDSAIVQYYSNDSELIWLSVAGRHRKKVLLHWLEQLDKHGVNPNSLGLKQIRQTEEKLRAVANDDNDLRNLFSARLEYLFTRSYLRYVCGMDFGFVNPAPIYNNLYEDLSAYSDTVAPPANRKKVMRRLFDIPLKYPTSRYALGTIDLLKKNVSEAFRRVQPITLYYQKLQIELQRVKSFRRKENCVRANLERSRWKYKQSLGRKYVYVNTAAYMLKAVDEDRDTLFEMNICCGSFKHKTPLIAARLNYFELNPNWVVPSKIVRKEMVPAFVRDSNYFARNNLQIYDKKGKRLNPRHINWSKYTNGFPFNVKQDSGEGSDLGRIIFRFPNRYSVYLHDTSSRWLFKYNDRGVSHGCIRLERPLDLAYFLLGYPSDEKMDCIRLAIGRDAKTEKGKELFKESRYKNRRFYGFKQSVPLFIDYRTLYMGIDGSLTYCEDHYGYDEPLITALAHLK